jgi:VWFA-related protein
VDDLGLSWESMYYAKRGLHAFIDRDLGPTDLVAIVRTGGSIGGLQPFTTDRRLLHATIDRLRWSGFSRSGVEAFEALNDWTTFDDRTGMADVNDFKTVNALRSSMSAAGTLGALNLAIQGARDLPGRKAVVFVSEGFEVMVAGEPDTRVRYALDRAIDQAARAGVVIYALDARGLQTGGLTAADNLKRPSAGGGMEETVRGNAAERLALNRDTQEALAYLAEQTGGFAVLNTNDLARGLGRISQDVRDYYVIGYVPDEGTFVRKGQKPRYHKISVKVRRSGLRVRTRKEFLGVSDPAEPPGPAGAGEQLIRAAISPFSETDLELRATTLPGYSPAEGTFLRALLHVDARALTFTDDDAGRKTASADVLGMVFDRDGTQVAHLSTGFSVALTNEAAEETLRDGLVYTLRIKIPRAGAYQVRFAVRDQQSGRLGSAGEFVEVADMARGEFALSGIVLQSNDGAADREDSGESIGLSPSQALRVYRPGTGLSYAYEVYNATKPVQAAPSIWRGVERVLTVRPDTLVPPAGGGRRFAARGSLKLGAGLAPGSYALQVSAATPDPKRKGRFRTAVQRITFEVQ